MFSAMLGTLQYTIHLNLRYQASWGQVYVQCNVRHPAIHNTIYLNLRYQASWGPGLCSVQCKAPYNTQNNISKPPISSIVGGQVYVERNVRHPAIHNTISTPPISSMVGARSMFGTMLGTLQYTTQYLHLRYQASWEPGLCSAQC